LTCCTEQSFTLSVSWTLGLLWRLVSEADFYCLERPWDMALGSSSDSERQRGRSGVLVGVFSGGCFRGGFLALELGFVSLGMELGVSGVVGWCAAWWCLVVPALLRWSYPSCAALQVLLCALDRDRLWHFSCLCMSCVFREVILAEACFVSL